MTPTPLPTSRPVTGFISHENPILGYRVTLPDNMRRSSAHIVAGGSDVLGTDEYTHRTEAQDREACLMDAIPRLFADDLPNVLVSASRNTDGLSAETWATTPRYPGAQPLSTHMLVERTTVDGREAVRLVRDQAQNREPAAYVIRAGDRMYLVHKGSDSIPSRLPARVFDDIATSFRVTQALPFPTAAPQRPALGGEAARDVAERLGRAFAARDMDAVAGLITPRCWLGTLPVVPPGTGVDGSTRAVVPLLAAFRDAFASGALLAVAVDSAVQTNVVGSGAFRSEEYFVRSDWSSPRGAMRVDLYFSEVDGRMYWTGMRFYQNEPAPCELRRILHGEQLRC